MHQKYASDGEIRFNLTIGDTVQTSISCQAKKLLTPIPIRQTQQIRYNGKCKGLLRNPKDRELSCDCFFP